MTVTDIDQKVESTHQYFPWIDLKVGESFTGEVTDAWTRPKRKYQSTELDLTDDGKTKDELVVNVKVDGEDKTFYTKFQGQLAIFSAVRKAGGRLSEGGTLTVTRLPDGEPPQKGFKPPIQIEAEFTPNDAEASDLDGV